MSECECALMLVHCDLDDPICIWYGEDLLDDYPSYDEPEGRAVLCVIGADCYDEACLHYRECRRERHQTGVSQ